MNAPRTAIPVVDLPPEHEALYFACLEEGPGAVLAQAGDHKRRWFETMRQRGLRVKLALLPDGRPGGMVQSLPIEHSPALGSGLEFILCIWVHGRPMARGGVQGRGLGTALLEAAEADARARGVKGMAAWGLALPFWMKASWFRRHGYLRADRRGLAALVWKPLTESAEPPRWPADTGRRPDLVPGKVVVTGCVNGWCPAQNLAFERARRAAAPYGERVECRKVDTIDREALLAWGESDALYVDRSRIRTGPPPSEASLARIIGRRVRRLRRGAGSP